MFLNCLVLLSHLFCPRLIFTLRSWCFHLKSDHRLNFCSICAVNFECLVAKPFSDGLFSVCSHSAADGQFMPWKSTVSTEADSSCQCVGSYQWQRQLCWLLNQTSLCVLLHFQTFCSSIRQWLPQSSHLLCSYKRKGNKDITPPEFWVNCVMTLTKKRFSSYIVFKIPFPQQ